VTVLADFRCPVHGVFELRADPDSDLVSCPHIDATGLLCARPSPWSPSPLRFKIAIAAARSGGIDRPEHRDWDFTRNLEEGQDPDEWQADRDAAAEERRKKLVSELARSE
jgi:hypothetical protein